LTRLDLQSHITETLSLDVMLPAPGQGALAAQCRADDVETLGLLAAIHDPLTSDAVTAERAFLAGLGGGCSLPIGAFAQKTDGQIILTGGVISEDGKRAIRLSAVDQDPRDLGERLAHFVLERGAAELIH
jgi:hydroxymethylbilane synthase